MRSRTKQVHLSPVIVLLLGLGILVVLSLRSADSHLSAKEIEQIIGEMMARQTDRFDALSPDEQAQIVNTIVEQKLYPDELIYPMNEPFPAAEEVERAKREGGEFR